jgi:hypothetical protein
LDIKNGGYGLSKKYRHRASSRNSEQPTEQSQTRPHRLMLRRFMRRRYPTHQKLGIQRYKGRAGSQIATLFGERRGLGTSLTECSLLVKPQWRGGQTGGSLRSVCGTPVVRTPDARCRAVEGAGGLAGLTAFWQKRSVATNKRTNIIASCKSRFHV